MNNGLDGGGSRGRGRGSWTSQAESTPRELRRPHAAQQASGLANSEQTPNDKPKYTLSAEAKEWYPPNYVPPTQQSSGFTAATADGYRSGGRSGRFSVQNRIRINQTQDPYNFEQMNTTLQAEDNADLRESITYLINVMCEVTFSPGKFDVLCGPLVDSFASTLHDETYTRLLIDAIVNQSIAEPNFRYNGARLCSMYDSITPEESTFRPCLLERCSAEESKIISGGEPLEENMRGFAMFLAEIYTQLEDTQGGRVKSLGESLCKILLYLLDTQDQSNVKTVCQILKLSGIALDADCPRGMQVAMSRLLHLQDSMPVVRNVVALRANRWGVVDAGLLRQHSDSTNGEPGTPTSPALGNPNDSIYMPDGHALTAEEKAFLQSNMIEDKAADDEDILAELETDNWEAGMDPEMQVGFLEFLKMSNQIKR